MAEQNCPSIDKASARPDHFSHLSREALGDKSLLFSFLQPVAIPLDVDRSAMMENPVEDSRCNHMIPEYVSPLAVRLIGCEYRRSPLVSSGYELEETMSTMIVEGEVSHLIDYQKLKFSQTTDLLFELSLLGPPWRDPQPGSKRWQNVP